MFRAFGKPVENQVFRNFEDFQNTSFEFHCFKHSKYLSVLVCTEIGRCLKGGFMNVFSGPEGQRPGEFAVGCF